MSKGARLISATAAIKNIKKPSGWKILLPLGLLNVVITGVIIVLVGG